jgi:hypothetical protein
MRALEVKKRDYFGKLSINFFLIEAYFRVRSSTSLGDRSLSEAEGTDEKINEKQGKKTIFEPSSLSLQ